MTDSSVTLAPIALRPAEVGDRAMILDSWFKSYSDSPWAHHVGRYGLFESEHPKVIERIVSSCPVIVACLEDDPEYIVGWACTRGPLIHYCYVKGKFRGNNVARAMLLPFEKDTRVQYTHTVPTKRLVDGTPKALPDGWRYNPYLLREWL